MEKSQLSLPFHYLVTPELDNKSDVTGFMDQLERSLVAGIRLVQLRGKTLSPALYKKLAIEVLACCQQYDVQLLLNADPELLNEVDAQGVHLDGIRLATCQRRPLDSNRLISAACHTLEQLKKAEALGVDFVTLSPVLPTASHPEAAPLGWQNFAILAAQTKLPVYALGGLTPQLLDYAQTNGAYGIAGIRSLWGGEMSLSGQIPPQG
ncbi:thiamine phosphate synthase [Glaciimonas sp. PAMC28666]|uniref:thiamine phosphate synthase n=1 Tax=Glaciimonas sp. PAMC28666 TaxID=2807626 RepID=UPI001963A43F|nr:thiamine phosphate synthase [Glaciimonas sp. PAMC28666]QRX84402.1 thiamine phosphate synthase [Glaciimonas sp. PAMC28666]